LKTAIRAKSKIEDNRTMKKISIIIPTYNEEGNIFEIYNRIINVFTTKLVSYKYEILFIDNDSQDNSKKIITSLALKDKNVKAIFNARNFGWVRSSYYGLINTSGDASVFLAADMQEPPELIPDFVFEWEQGVKIVVGIKNRSKENKVFYFLRTIYYKFIEKIAEIEHIEHFTGFGLYDKTFINILRNLHDPNPYLRGIVSELGYKSKKIYYEQDVRKSGKSKFNFIKLYDLAMLGITTHSKIGIRIISMLGFILATISLLIGIFYFIYKLVFWDSFSPGIAPVVIGVFFMGALQLFFIGVIGEYILNINTKILNRPLVIEEQRINF
jgi:glycosyltransferase involved in cell wall biosynthesis